jgi:hypothetical protein
VSNVKIDALVFLRQLLHTLSPTDLNADIETIANVRAYFSSNSFLTCRLPSVL